MDSFFQENERTFVYYYSRFIFFVKAFNLGLKSSLPSNLPTQNPAFILQLFPNPNFIEWQYNHT